MKISKILFSILFSSFFIVLSCDNEETVELYEPQLIDGDSISLAYEKLTTYPSLGSIKSTIPTISDIETPYGYRILKISSPTQSNFAQAAFSIDRESGIISYGNINNTISAGTFSIDVGVVNTNGMAVYENAFELIILDVPLDVVIDKNEVEAGIFEQGVMATISFTDTSGSDEITSVTYALIEPPVGFEINSSLLLCVSMKTPLFFVLHLDGNPYALRLLFCELLKSSLAMILFVTRSRATIDGLSTTTFSLWIMSVFAGTGETDIFIKSFNLNTFLRLCFSDITNGPLVELLGF